MLDWQIENPLEEYHLEERERAREVEDLIAEAELDRIRDLGGIENGAKMLETIRASQRKMEKGGGFIPGCGSSHEGNYQGVRLGVS